MTRNPPVPRPAATLVLVRDAAQGMEVFMMQRTYQAAFVPGGYVFPGGALDAADADPFFAACLPGFDDAAASRRLGLEAGGLAYFVAALRECFEESGLLLARDAQGRLADPSQAGLAAARQPLADGTLSFAGLCREFGLAPALDALGYFAHWITPAGAPRRFDTRFFVAAAPAGQTASHDNAETIGHLWIRPAEALERQRSGQFEMMFATVKTLQMLAQFADTAALMQHVGGMASIPTHMPRVTKSAQGRRVLIQGDHAYAEAGKLDPHGRGDVSCELLPGIPTLLGQGVCRIAAPNPGFMTGPGTNSYLIDTADGCALIDPGPALEAHIERLLAQAEGRIRWILTTHTHLDHSPAAAAIKARAGAARVIGMPAPATAGQDRDFAPDHVPADGETLELGGRRLRAIHTPGHASNHLCYLLEDERMLFTGDHIMQGSTVVINPPDGDMAAYLASLARIAGLEADWLAPGHGFLIENPRRAVDRLLAHRLARERKVLQALMHHGSAALEDLVAAVYDDVPAQRHAMAARSLLAHLHKLRAEGRAADSGVRWEITEAGRQALL